MGDKDKAPDAPEGWYPISGSETGERYWDGKSWTGETRGLAPEGDAEQEGQSTFESPQDLNHGKFKPFKPLLIAGALLLLVVILVSTITNSGAKSSNTASPSPSSSAKSSSSPSASSSSPRATSAPAAPWYPSGYSPYKTDLAVKWVDGAAVPPACGSGCTYWTLQIVSKYGCPGGIYAEVNILDSAGTNIGWTNDTLASLKTGQAGQLQFKTYVKNPKSASIAKITCR